MAEMADIFGASDSDSDEDVPFSAKAGASSNSAANIFGDSDSDSDDDSSKKSRLKKKKLGKKKKDKDKTEKRKRKEKRPLDAEEEVPRKKPSKNDSGDEYDSGDEVKATAEDKSFIEEDSDDDLGLSEYNKDQNFDDDRPTGYDSDEPRPKKSRPSGGGGHSRRKDSDNPLDQALARISAGKRKPKNKEKATDDRRLNEYIAEFLQRMDDEAKRDRITHKNKQPAFGKLNMLPTVIRMMQNRSYQRNLLELNLLAAVNEWLTPLDDGALASHAIRTQIYEGLLQLPVQTDHLRRSGIGKLIMALWNHPKETKENKATLKTLIEKWARPVFNKFTDHRNDTDTDRAPQVEIKRRKKKDFSSGEISLKAESVGNEAVQTMYGMVKSDRVQIPMPLNFNFKKRVASGPMKEKIKTLNPESKRGKLDKRTMLSKRMAKKGERAVSCSIEGRGMG